VATAVIRARARGRFFNLVDHVNQLGAQEPMHQLPCGNAPDFARYGACAAQAVISVGVMMAGGR
jgi:hypothetical protein